MIVCAPSRCRKGKCVAAFALGFLASVNPAALFAASPPAAKAKPAVSNAPVPTVGKMEILHRFYGAMPTGITVSKTGRIFVNYPRWGDPVPFTVGEIKNGKEVPFPDAAINRFDRAHPSDCFVCVQSVVVDAKDRLWVLDPAAPKLGPAVPGGPKLVCIDLATNQVTKKIVFDPAVVDKNSYLNDVRFDFRQGTEGIAYITDSGAKSHNGIIVVDLAAGKAWRRLGGHPSVRPVPKFLPIVEGKPLLQRKPGQPPKPIALGSDGIALSADGETLYYCPLASRHLYSVQTAALRDPAKTNADAVKTVRDLGSKGSGSDGLESDDKGNLYVTRYEQNAVAVRSPGGSYHTLLQDPRLLWPDTLSVAADGFLYGTANQLERQPTYHYGAERRVKPYLLYRVRSEGGPVALVSSGDKTTR